ncbi:MAG: VPDSG-CTERM sorting domain-containing protein [Verrucomicrobia bacterium]|nr:VPDSG-CTERM sorting domain-containing protein [Verrucomicrobiota bacterium]
MKYKHIITLLCAATASFLIASTPAQANFIVTLQQVGSNVVATGSGAIDLTGLHGPSPANGASAIVPVAGDIVTGSGNGTLYLGPISGPTSFGTGGPTDANSSTGPLVSLLYNGGITSSIIVPSGYVSGTLISNGAIYNGQSFASLGVTPGTYEWTWGTGANQNFTLEIGTSRVPDSGSTMVLLGASLFGLIFVRHFFFSKRPRSSSHQIP